jgi:hypothetical protein
MKRNLHKALYLAVHVSLIPANFAFRLPAQVIRSKRIRHALDRMSETYDQFHMKVFDTIDPDRTINEELLKQGW